MAQSILSLPQNQFEEALRQRAAESVRKAIKRHARDILARPWMIEQALYPNVLGAVPQTPSAQLVTCQRLISEARTSASVVRSYAPGHILTLRGAQVALRYLRRFQPVEDVPAFEVEAA